jgi:hypothetical protein
MRPEKMLRRCVQKSPLKAPTSLQTLCHIAGTSLHFFCHIAGTSLHFIRHAIVSHGLRNNTPSLLPNSAEKNFYEEQARKRLVARATRKKEKSRQHGNYFLVS